MAVLTSRHESDILSVQGKSIFMDAYVMGARWHMDRFRTTREQLAVVAAKNRFHGSLNPLAQHQQDMGVEEMLAENSGGNIGV